jgi:transposase
MTDSLSHPSRARVFSPTFKEAAVARVESGEALAGVARSLGIARKILYDWRNAFHAEGMAGLSRKRGRKRGWRVKPPGFLADDPPDAALAGVSELARAQRRIAELERLAGRQQMGLDFFQKALQVLNAAPVLKLQVSRWRCCSATCARQTFVAPHPVLFRLHGRRALRAEQIVRLIGHSVARRAIVRASWSDNQRRFDYSRIEAWRSWPSPRIPGSCGGH